MRYDVIHKCLLCGKDVVKETISDLNAKSAIERHMNRFTVERQIDCHTCLDGGHGFLMPVGIRPHKENNRA